MSGPTLTLSVTAFVALLAGAVVISIAAERLRIPAAVALVAVGTVVGSVFGVRPPFAFGPALLVVFLPPLVFEGAWSIDLRALRRVFGRIAALAFPGTLVTAFGIAGAVALSGALPFDAALLLGAMVSATDPVAVVSVFRRVGAPQDVRTIVEGESLANDGVAVVLYGSALALSLGAHVAWPRAAAFGVVQIGGAIAIGAAVAFGLVRLLRLASVAEYEVTGTLAAAYAAYLSADALGLSGIFATATCAIALRAALRSDDGMLSNVDAVDDFWGASAYIANALVFVATGLLIDAPRALHEPLLIGTAIALVLVLRIVLAVAVSRDRRARITIVLAGMRGALPLALALSLPENVPHRPEIIDAVFATVLVTLVLQGLPLERVVARLYPKDAPATD